MTIPGFIILNIIAGASIAYAARIQIRSLQRPLFQSRYFTALWMLEIFLFLPLGMYFNAFYSDWSWMYMIDTANMAPGLGVMVLLAYPLAALSGYLVSHFSAQSNNDWVSMMFMAFLTIAFGLLLVLGSDKFISLGTYAQYHNDVNLVAISSTSLLPSLIVAWLGIPVVWGYIVFRFWQEGRMTSPQKRK